MGLVAVPYALSLRRGEAARRRRRRRAARAHAAVNARLLRVPTATHDRRARVSVLLPVRDEARAGRAVPAGAARRRPASTSRSSCSTTARPTAPPTSCGGSADGDPRVRLLTGRAAAAGWLGKPHACQQLADAAAPTQRRAGLRRRRRRARAARRRRDRRAARRGRPRPASAPTRGRRRPARPALVQPLLQWSWLTFLPLRLAERCAAAVAVGGERPAARRAPRGVRPRRRARRGARRGGRGRRAAARGQARRRHAAASSTAPRSPPRRMYDSLGRARRRLHQVAVDACRVAGRSALLGAAVRRAAAGRAARLAGRRSSATPRGSPDGSSAARRTGGRSLPGRARPPGVGGRCSAGLAGRVARLPAGAATLPGRGGRLVSRVVVVGAGVGGLAAAARLAALGHDVTVCEAADDGRRQARAGRARRPGVGDFRFDTGPSLRDDAARLPRPVRRHRRLAGGPRARAARPDRALPLRRRHRLRRDAATSTSSAAGSTRALGAGSGDDWRALHRRAPSGSGRRAAGRSSSSRCDGPRTLARLAAAAARATSPPSPRAARCAALGRRTCATRGCAMFLDRYATYTGSDPRRAPAALAAVPYAEQAYGGWYVPGGLHRLGEALHDRGRRARGARPARRRVTRIERDRRPGVAASRSPTASGCRPTSSSPTPTPRTVYGSLRRRTRAPPAGWPARRRRCRASCCCSPSRAARPGWRTTTCCSPPTTTPSSTPSSATRRRPVARPDALRQRARRPGRAPGRLRGVVRARQRPAARHGPGARRLARARAGRAYAERLLDLLGRARAAGARPGAVVAGRSPPPTSSSAPAPSAAPSTARRATAPRRRSCARPTARPCPGCSWSAARRTRAAGCRWSRCRRRSSPGWSARPDTRAAPGGTLTP